LLSDTGGSNWELILSHQLLAAGGLIKISVSILVLAMADGINLIPCECRVSITVTKCIQLFVKKLKKGTNHY